MASATRNVKLGVCSVTFDGVDLGYTKGGVEIAVATTTKEVEVDQFGNSPINEYIMGRTCVAKVPLAETTLELMSRIMPGAVLTGTGGVAATGTVTFVTAPAITDDKVTVNGVDFIFKTTPTASNHMAIGATITIAAQNLVAAINASINPLVSQVTASNVAGVVTITADDKGVAGNAITLAKLFVTPANCTVSGATLTGGVDIAIKSVVVPNAVGTSLLALAKKLVFHPQALAPEDRSEDFTIPLAMTAGAATFSYKLDQERVFSVDFKAYPDSVTRKLFVYGDERAV